MPRIGQRRSNRHLSGKVIDLCRMANYALHLSGITHIPDRNIQSARTARDFLQRLQIALIAATAEIIEDVDLALVVLSRRSARFEPINPAPPKITTERMGIFLSHRLAAPNCLQISRAKAQPQAVGRTSPAPVLLSPRGPRSSAGAAIPPAPESLPQNALLADIPRSGPRP